jgi:hypothetical protein
LMHNIEKIKSKKDGVSEVIEIEEIELELE